VINFEFFLLLAGNITVCKEKDGMISGASKLSMACGDTSQGRIL
jgi:hypothetical protein